MSPPFVLHSTFGALFIGLIAASTLYGISLVQAVYYYGHQNDSWVLKSLVAAVLTFETVHQVLISHAVYSYTITNWGDPDILQRIIRSITIQVLFTGFTAVLVKSYMTTRVWRFSKGKIWLTGPIGLLVLAEFVCVLVGTIKTIHFQTYVQLVPFRALIVTENVLQAAGDILIAGALCTLLHFSRSGFHRSDTIINKLIVFTVNTGLLTSLCAIAQLITIVVAGDTLVYIAIFLCIGRLYTNSLLATLNARKIIRKATDNISISTGDKVNVALHEFPRNAGQTSRQAANISIKINTTKEFMTDTINDLDHDMDKADASSSNAPVFEEKNRVRSFPDA